MAEKQFTHKDLAKEMRKAPVSRKRYTHRDLAIDLRQAPPPHLPRTNTPNEMLPHEISYNGKKATLVPMADGFMVVGNGAESIYQRMRKMLEAPKKKAFKPTVPKKMK